MERARARARVGVFMVDEGTRVGGLDMIDLSNCVCVILLVWSSVGLVISFIFEV